MTTTMTRSDPHRIAVLDPAEYRLAAWEDVHDEEGYFEWFTPTFSTSGYYARRYNFGQQAEQQVRVREELDGRRAEQQGFGCVVCGQAHGNRYWAFFEHIPTGEIIQVGSNCSRKVGLGSREELEELLACERRVLAVERGHFLARDPLARQAIEWAQRRVEHFNLQPQPHGSGLMLNYDERTRDWAFEEEFARDLVVRFNRYADITEKQIALALKLRGELAEKELKVAAREAKRAEEEAAKKPIPADVLDGRAVLTGEILTAKWQDSDFDGAFKMLVLDDRGFKVWGTCPDAVLDHVVAEITERYEAGEYERGEVPSGVQEIKNRAAAEKPYRVTFAARVEVSKDDECFGFFKRPTKVEVGE